MEESQLLSAIWQHFNKLENPTEIVSFIGKVKYVAILWLKKNTLWSERRIAQQMGVSNTLISDIKSIYQSKVKFEEGGEK